MTVNLQCPSPTTKFNQTVSNTFGCILNHAKRYKLHKDLQENVKIHENLNLRGSSKIITDLLARRSREVSPTHQY